MNNLSSIALLVTYQCNIECKHCGLSCSPRNKEWMTMDEMRNIAIQASDLGAKSIILTGGEPTLIKHEELCNYFRFIKKETSINNIRIVTNGHWAKSFDKAYAVLKEWKESGLDELNVSCGEFHQEYVPVENIGNAYKAGCDLEYITVLLAGEFTKSKRKGKLTPYEFEKVLDSRIVQHHEVSPFVTRKHAMTCNSAVCYGRGNQFILPEDIPPVKYENLPNTCKDTISTLSLHPDGNVTICCSVGVRGLSFLSIGNWRDERLKKISTRANDDFLSNLIRFYGLKALKEKLMATRPEAGLCHRLYYTGVCELCFELFTNEKIRDYLNTDGLKELEDELVTRKIMHLSTIYSPNYVYQ
jgi:MoaA/NifB/PqqE/SkfB family radical SAM enzyme